MLLISFPIGDKPETLTSVNNSCVSLIETKAIIYHIFNDLRQ